MASHALLNPTKSSNLFPKFQAFCSLFSSLCRGRSSPFSIPRQAPPVPKKVPFTVSAHGTSSQDPYHWMSNTTDPDLSAYLHRENSYAQAFMADTHNLQQTLFSEMKSRIPTNISTPPERFGPWLYYQYVPEGKEYPVLCRKLATQTNGWAKSLLNYLRGEFGSEKLLLDWNEIAEQYGYVHVGTCRVSPDHNFLAYTLDITGSERFILQIKDLRDGCIIPDLSVDGVVSLAWAQDGCTLFYTTSDENHRPYRVLYVKLGSDAVNVPIYTESDSSFCVDITSTKDGKFITVNSNSRGSSEVYVINSTSPQDSLRRLNKRVPGVQYFLEHHYGFFYILTNAPFGSKELYGGGYYLARCQVDDVQLANWENVILPSEDISLQDMDIFHGHLVLFLNKKGCSMICSINMPIDMNCKKATRLCTLHRRDAQYLQQMKMEDLNPWFFPSPSNSCRVVPCSNHDFKNSVYRVVVSSPVMPDMIIDYDMWQREFSIVQQEEVLGVSCNSGSCSQTYDPNTNKLLDAQNGENKHVQILEVQRWKDFSDAYCCERKDIISHDGVKVPLTILYSREAWKKNESPGLLQGYGAYGEVLDKSWCANRLSLLDRGWVVAFADVRGGGGPDPSWHKSGSGLSKLNSIYDFVSCGKYLLNEGYVNEDQLAAIGYSAGGLLVGAAINTCPDIFRAAILKVPFLDICNTLLDPNLPLTTLDYEEFGNPQIQSQLESILSYSPYDNIPQGSCHPSMLVTASFHDSRVGVWEAAKWVAKVRDSTCSSCSRGVILKTSMSGGHFGEGGLYGQCEETAYEYAFLMKVMGISWDTK